MTTSETVEPPAAGRRVEPLVGLARCSQCGIVVVCATCGTHCCTGGGNPCCEAAYDIQTELDDQYAKLAEKHIQAQLTAVLRRYWSFNNRQEHTHSWHDREDFIEKRLPEICRGSI